MPNEDGQFHDEVRRAAQNLDETAGAAPPADLVDEDDFGVKDETDVEDTPDEDSDDDAANDESGEDTANDDSDD